MLTSFGCWHEARAAFREALRLEPGDSQTLYLLGVSLSQEGEYVEAVRALEGAAGGNPRNETFRPPLAVARELLRRSEGGSR